MKKVCNCCKENKELENFCKNKRFPDGLNTTCKICTKLQSSKTRSKTKIQISQKQCSSCHEIKIVESFTKNPSTLDGFNSKCKICRGVIDKLYRDKIKDKVKINNREYRIKNYGSLKTKHREYKEERIKKDPIFKLSLNISSLIRMSFKNKSIKKSTKTHDILGIDFEGFSRYLNDNIFGFKITDENMDLDHIIPISFGTNEEELIMLNHYTNFQLLPSKYNREVKQNKVLGHDHLQEWLESNS